MKCYLKRSPKVDYSGPTRVSNEYSMNETLKQFFAFHPTEGLEGLFASIRLRKSG
jgi:hypothetical protein